MFIGHFGLGFAGKKIDPRPSLGTLFMAAQFIDLLWPIFLIMGIERVEIDPGNTAFTPLNFIHYPFTHSLFGVVIWAILFAAVYYIFRRNQRGTLLVGGLVISHWFLDLLAHRPDLPLVPWSDIRVGFGLWNSVLFSIVIESIIFLVGVFIYMKMTHAVKKVGTISLWGLLIFLVIIYIMNIFGPPPESVEPIGYIGLAQWLLIAWAYWIDRNRTVADSTT